MDPEPNPPTIAQQIFSDFLQRKIAGEPLSWQSFRSAHAAHAEHLDALYQDYRRGRALMGAADTSRQASSGDSAQGRTADGGEPGEDAERILFDAMSAELEFDTPDLEQLCARHPNLADQLRQAHAGVLATNDTLRQALRGSHALPRASRPIAGRFTPIAELGRGGMSIVLAAWDSRLRRRVALKCLRHEAAAGTPNTTRMERRRARLVNEAQVLAQLDHPGIVPVHDIVQDEKNGEVYVAMLRVRGVDLRQIYARTWANEKGWSLARAVTVLQRVCEAVAYAHDKGVLHRDLKPANVMVGAFGETFVMDWGLARSGTTAKTKPEPARVSAVPLETGTTDSIVVTDRDEHRDTDSSSALYTQEGDVLGTPSYIAPEQAAGQVETADVRADVYSVGAMLYELLAHRAPFEQPGEPRSSTQILAAVRAGSPVPLATLALHAPAELVAIAEKAMARSKPDRYPSMRALADDLRAFLEGRVVRAHQHGALAALRKWMVRNKSTAAALGAAAVFLAYTLITKLAHGNELLAINRELRARDYRNRVALAATALHNGDPGEARVLLADAPDELRCWEWRYLSSELDTSWRTLLGAGPRAVGLAFAPDSGRVASGDQHGSVSLWDVASGRRLAVSQSLGAPVLGLSFTPEGNELLASTAKPSIESLQADTLAIAQPSRFAEVAAAHGKQHALDVFASQCGHLVFTASQLGCVGVWDRPSGRLRHQWTGHRDWVTFLAQSRDGTRLASGSADGSARVWEIATGRLLNTLGRNNARVDGVAFSPDGRQLLTGDWRGHIDLWDIDTGQHKREVAVLPAPIYRFAWSPRDCLVAAASGPTVHLFDSTDWKRSDCLSGLDQIVCNVAFSPDGLWLAASDHAGVVKLWQLSVVRGRQRHAANQGAVAGMGFDAATGHCVVVRQWGHIEIWDPRRGALVQQARRERSVVDAAMAPDGHWLVVCDRSGTAEVVDVMTLQSVAHYRQPGERFLRAAVHYASRRVFLPRGDTSVIAYAVGNDVPLWRSPRVVAGTLERTSIAGDGSMLALSTNAGGVALVDTARGHARGFQVSTQRVTTVYLSADGDRVLVRRIEGNIAMLATDTGRELWQVPAVAAQSECLLSPDGTRVFLGSAGGDLIVLDAATGRRVVALQRDRVATNRVSASSDGHTLATAGIDNAIRFWNSTPAAGR
jgi:WD40 repeat protein/serine/threonine protein kinase